LNLIKVGELASNLADKKLFSYDGSNVFEYGSNSFLGLTGGTINGDLNVTGNTIFSGEVIANAVSATSVYTDYIDFNTTYIPTQQEGRIHWDSDYGTLDVDLEGNNLNLKVGLDNLYYIKNQSGSTIEKGKVVRAAGTLGGSGRILGEYMIADGSIPHYFTLGIAGENILDGEDGYVYEFGLVKGVNTTGSIYGETWTGGTILYVHPTIAGALTSIEPIEPNLKIQIAIVINAASNGSLFVRPSLSYNLGDLHNTQTSGETNGDLISYDSSGGYWKYTKELTGDYIINGSLSAVTINAGAISATTYYNLPIDPNYYITGGTVSGSDLLLNRNDGNVVTIDTSSLDGLWSQSGSNIYYNSGNVGIGTSSPLFNLDIVSSGGTGSFENITRFRTIDSTDYLAITNAVSTDGSFNPVLRSFNNTNTSTNLYIQSVIDPSVDTGVNPLIMLQGRVSTEPGVDPWSGVTTRPILRVRNNSTNLLDVTADGKVGIGTTSPSHRLSISGSSGLIETRVDKTLPYTSEIYGQTTNASGSSVIQLVNDIGRSIVMGVLGSNRGSSVAYGGESDDAFLFASTTANNLNIFNGAGTGTEDSINFYAGNNAAATPHVHIHGSGSTKGYVGIGTKTPNKKLEVIGEAQISGSGQNVLTIIGSGDTNPLFTVQGSNGQLFSVTDSLIGDLFSVNDISGLPILKVNSDDEILMGNYQAPSLNTTFKSSISAGLTELYSIPISAYTGGFFEYTLVGSGARAGSIMSIFSGSSVNYTETTTTDIGDTSPITFDMNVSGGTANLTVSATTGTWEIKTIVRSI
jgi:hypothetical protein